MFTPRTEGSALLALILAVVILLVSRGPESQGSPVAIGLACALGGAGVALAAVCWTSGKGALRRSTVAREKCDEIRDLLVAELHAFEEEERRPVPPIRMSRNEEQAPADSRKAA